MNRLYLLRHARARWGEPGSRDYDPPLEESGKADAQALASLMLAAGYVPDLVLCSGALRARETWNAASHHLEAQDVRYLDSLYSSDAAGYLDIIRESGDAASIMVVGHNPMMEDLCSALARKGTPTALASVARGFPTCGLAVISFPEQGEQIAPKNGYLEDFLAPVDL